MTTGITEAIILLDRSGSMQAIKNDMEGAIARYIEEQQVDDTGKLFLSLFQFDNEFETVFKGVDIHKVQRVVLNPRGSTALIDAACRAIDECGRDFAKRRSNERPDNVVFILVTDGEENSSCEFTRAQLLEKIKHQTDKYGWLFLYFGTELNGIADAQRLGFAYGNNRSIYYAATPDSVNQMSATASATTSAVRAGNKVDIPADIS